MSLNPSLGGGIILPPLPVGFPWHFAALVTFYRDNLAEFGIPDLPQSPDIGQNSDGGIFDFRISGQFLIKVNCRNSRASDDIDTNLGPVTKLEKRNKTISKKLMKTSCRQIVTSLSFSRFMANLEQSRNRILDV